MRLPRDWLGPREELVPFGPRAASRVPDESSPTDDAAPSAEDFWGERSAAIHSALQAPSDWAPLLPEKPELLTHNGKSYQLALHDAKPENALFSVFSDQGGIIYTGSPLQ